MILRILLIAPELPGIDAVPELRTIASRHQVMPLTGAVSARDIYQHARDRSYHVLHFATHSHDELVVLSNGETFTPEDVASVGKLAGAELVFFNSCRSGLLANYAVRHGLSYAVYANIDLPDTNAWKMPSSFYDFLFDQPEGAADYAAAFYRADSGDGIHGLSISPQMLNCWQTILDELKHHSDDIGRLRRDLDRFMVVQRMMLGLLFATAVLALGGMLSN